jgi:hypothetical protein
MSKAFETYFNNSHHLEGSAALLARVQHGMTTGLPASDRARGEVGSSMALVNNTVPSVFWLLYHIYSDFQLLQECRDELSSAIRVEDDGMQNIDLGYVRSSCPILNSTLLEVFRFYGIGTILIRQVCQDVTLDSFHLKKGGIVLMPNIIQHFSSTSWGPDVRQTLPLCANFLK